MEIQWIIPSIKYLAGADSELFNIIGIVHRINLDKYKGIGTIHLIAKIHMMPHEESTQKAIRLEITRNQAVQSFEIPYTLPSWKVWVEEFVPYVVIPIRNFHFEPGEYTFKMTVDGELKAEESIIAGYYGGRK
jgi:hypothetical protein